MRKFLFLFIFLCLSLAQEVPAASFSGQIIADGQWDNYGQQIQLINSNVRETYTGITAINGCFHFDDLPIGKYILIVEEKNGIELVNKAINIPAEKFLYKYAGQKTDTLSFVVLNLLLTMLLFGAAILIRRKNLTPKSRKIFWLVISFVLYTGTDFLQNILAWHGLESLAGDIFFLKHIGSAWFGYLFYRYWAAFGVGQRGRNFIWLPALETLILCSWPFFGLDSMFEHFWFFSFAQLRMVIMVQLICFLGAGVWAVLRQRVQEKDILVKNILTATQYVFGLLILLLLGLVLLPLVLRQGTEYFDQQYILTALVFGLILFGWLASIEIYMKLLHTQRRLEQQERLSALGVLASGLAHEIKNPMAAINNLVRLLPVRYKNGGFRRDFMDIVPRQIDRINNLLVNLLDLSRPSAGVRKRFDLTVVLGRALDLLAVQLNKQNVSLAREFSSGLFYRGDPRALEQVFLNLSLNALQAMPRGGKLTVSANVDEKIITFQDTGIGIEPEILSKIFDPFFSTKKTGTGLGLSISKKILDEHKIKIEITSQFKKGTRVKLIF